MALWRSIATVGSFTAISRVAGFVRDILMTAIIGAGFVADCFVVAFKLPNFFRRLFAEGAFNAAFVPLFAEKLQGENGRADSIRFAEDTLAVLLTVLLIFVALVQIFMPGFLYVLAYGFVDQPEKFDLAVTLTRFTFPYLLFISLVSLLGGMLNALDRFAAVAATPIVLNLTLISSLLFLTPYFPTGGHALALGVSIGGVLQFVWLVVALRREGIQLRLRRPRLTPGVKKLLILMAPVALGAGAVQVNLLIDVLIASFLPSGSISYLFYADRLNQLPIGVVGVAVSTALLPLLSRQVASGSESDAVSSLNRAMEISLFLTIPAAAALLVIPGPLISALFERGAYTVTDTAATAAALAAYAAGLPAYVLIKALGTPYFARQDTKTPVIFSVIALVVNTILNLILMQYFGHVGLAMATAISAWLNVAMYVVGLIRLGYMKPDRRLLTRVPRVVLASAVMAGAIWYLAGQMGIWSAMDEFDRAVSILIVVATGGVVFAVLSQITGALRFQELRGLIRGKSV